MSKNSTSIPEKKNGNIAQMFDSIALAYDPLNHIFSFNIDKLWRYRAANVLRGQPLGKVLDVATGTADFALIMQKRLQTEHITGIDISTEMLAVGRQKIERKGLENKISLHYGNAEALPFDTQAFDVVTVTFGVRHFENLEKGLSEMYRVLKTGGKVVILELTIPKNRIVRGFHHLYISYLLPFLGRLFSPNGKVYKYLPKSVRSIPHWEEFKIIMENCGFNDVKIKSLGFGGAGIYIGLKK